MEYTGGDVVTTTQIMDIHIEMQLIHDYTAWALDCRPKTLDEISFLIGLGEQLEQDNIEVLNEAGTQMHTYYEEYSFEESTEGPWRLRTPRYGPVSESSDDMCDRSRKESSSEPEGSNREISSDDLNAFKQARIPHLGPQGLATVGLYPFFGTAVHLTSSPPQLAHRMVYLCSDKNI